MKRIEAEKDELVLQNESGDYAIIPADRRAEVQQLLKDGCYECIDKIVSELPAMSDYAEDGMVISNDPPNLIPNLLKTIGQLESSDNYDVTVGMKKNPNLVNMTINEVIDYSRSLGNSGAAGRYQIIPGTLEGLRDKGYVKGDDIFNAETQDKLAIELIKGRGLNKYLKGTITADEFADNLSKEWAGLPYNTDKSYWAGVGNNKSLMSRKDFMATVFGIQQPKEQPVEEVSQALSYDDPIKLAEQLPITQNMSNEMPAISQEYLQDKKSEPEITDKDIEYAKAIIARENKVKDKDLKYLPLQVLIKTLGKRNNKYSMLSNNPAFLSLLENKIKNGL